jgi:hypothetical protein
MPYLPYISDADLISHLNSVINIGKNAKKNAPKKFHSNVIDPFGPIFEMAIHKINSDEWEELETIRQIQKTIQNAVGDFHNDILGSVAGWSKLAKGGIVDLVKNDHTVIAEIKNKYNTVSGGKLKDHYDELSGLVNQKNSIYFGATSYFAQIIPKKPGSFDRCFTPPDKATGKLKPADNKVREIDGRSFYAMVTGYHDALDMLHAEIPNVLAQTGTIGNGFSTSDLKELSDYFGKAYF